MILLLLANASAAPITTPDRPTFPFRSIAGEDGVHVMYQNPALMSYDRDPMFGLYYDTQSGQMNSLTFATTGEGLGAGVGYRQIEDGSSWWTVSGGLGLRLDRSLAIGTSLHWQLPDGGDNNFVSWDIGLGWRPTPWLGLGGSVQNLGNPSPEQGVFTRYGAGLAIRPVGDIVTAGLDWGAYAPPDAGMDHHLIGSVRVRPAKGLWLRLYADQSVSNLKSTEIGGALEMHFGRLGVGVVGRGNLDNGTPAEGAYLVTVPGEDRLFDSRTTVAEFIFRSGFPYAPLPGEESEPYLSMLRRLETASKDPQVKGILLHMDGLDLSYAQIEEVRGLIKAARANHKPVVGFIGEDGSTRAYYLASACDRIYLHPAASLDLVGLSAEIQYFKGAMDMVGIQAQYARRSEYKSAPEPNFRENASDAAKEEMNGLLDDLFAAIVDGIAQGRGRKVEEVRQIIDGGPYTGQEAVDQKLVDGLVYPDDLDDTLNGVFPEGFERDDEYQLEPDTSGWSPNRAVAVVVIDGAITSGESSPGGLLGGAGTGSETVIAQLEQARRTDAVKAVVLRVDSPGGSAFASDEIWKEVEKLKEEGKPVIVSMGGYAASGGYYVSAGADAIFAEPSTVTGSIGVYGGKFSAGPLFDTLHINTETYLRGRNAAMFSMTRPFDAVEFAALDHLIGDTYRQFKEKVEQGRNLTSEQVETVARGHVWSGTAASQNGLVDHLGGFFDAVALARSQAGLTEGTPYSLITYNPWMGSPGNMPAMLVHAPLLAVRSLFPHARMPAELEQLAAMAAMRNERVFAMMPYRLELN